MKKYRSYKGWDIVFCLEISYLSLRNIKKPLTLSKLDWSIAVANENQSAAFKVYEQPIAAHNVTAIIRILP